MQVFEAGRYRVLKEQHDSGWTYNYIIQNMTSRKEIKFQAHHSYIQPHFDEERVAEIWHFQTVPIEKRRRLTA
jgi:hypothetical protein